MRKKKAERICIDTSPLVSVSGIDKDGYYTIQDGKKYYGPTQPGRKYGSTCPDCGQPMEWISFGGHWTCNNVKCASHNCTECGGKGKWKSESTETGEWCWTICPKCKGTGKKCL